jgi:hypothetical protein
MIYPKLVSQLNPHFNFPSCTFGLSKLKEKSARGVLWKLLSIPNIFTLETSFFGYRDKLGLEKEFLISDLNRIGRDAAKALYTYAFKYNSKSSTKRKNSITTDLLLEELQNKYSELKAKGEQDSGSDSDPSEDELEEREKFLIQQQPSLKFDDFKRNGSIDERKKIEFRSPVQKSKNVARGRVIKMVTISDKMDTNKIFRINDKTPVVAGSIIKVDKECQTSFSFEEDCAQGRQSEKLMTSETVLESSRAIHHR